MNVSSAVSGGDQELDRSDMSLYYIIFPRRYLAGGSQSFPSILNHFVSSSPERSIKCAEPIIQNQNSDVTLNPRTTLCSYKLHFCMGFKPAITGLSASISAVLASDVVADEYA
jgi:hypothetical protein